ncbi:hypothetical protein ACFPFV_00195 [Salinicoccus siamensis]|uniref:hypothetical protein n=1 Tax=Salinicoccus siamensis TaxID=381830 RepID=UPI00361D45EF
MRLVSIAWRTLFSSVSRPSRHPYLRFFYGCVYCCPVMLKSRSISGYSARASA